jgi:hypothetical protein
MSIAKELVEVDARFIQPCPFCQRMNRVVMHGLHDGKDRHPDMGYSFCNCKNMFYTKQENVKEPISYDPVDGVITAPDPFFAWPDPYEFKLWDVRRYYIIWPMSSLCDHLRNQGYEIVSAEHDFNLHSETPQHFRIKVKK